MTSISLTSINCPVQFLTLQDLYLPALNENERKPLGINCFFLFAITQTNSSVRILYLNLGTVYNSLFMGDVSFITATTTKMYLYSQSHNSNIIIDNILKIE